MQVYGTERKIVDIDSVDVIKKLIEEAIGYKG